MVEFQTQEGLPPRWAQKIESLAPDIHAEPATVRTLTIDYAIDLIASSSARPPPQNKKPRIQLEIHSFTPKCSAAEAQVHQRDQEIIELRQQLEDLENGKIAAEIESRRLQSWLDIDSDAKRVSAIV